MNYLSVEGLSKSYNEKLLFKEQNFGISRGEKVALVANNGSGKSTLLKIISGKETADAGKVSFRRGIRTAFLGQDPVFDDYLSVQDLLNGSISDIQNTLREYETLLQRPDFDNPEVQEAIEKAHAKIEMADAWNYEQKLKTILSKFNITDYNQEVSKLSGGQKKRLALALVLLDAPDLLILDEPTNHLDIEMIEWLEEYLKTNNLTLLMVTHDRYFLDRICTKIVELSDGKLYTHLGNYSYFLDKRAERIEAENVEIAKTNKWLKTEIEWVRRMPKARGTKSKSRVDAYEDTKEKTGGKKVQQEIKLDVKMNRIGGKILEMKKVYKSYGEKKILEGFDYTFKKGERIGIVGPNGVGKSTFLNILLGIENPDSGKVNTGDTIIFGYYNQDGLQLKEDKRVIEVVKDIADFIEVADGTKIMASQFLQHFMFEPEMQYNYVSKLSGGEKRRLNLLLVLLKNPNFLILDEPTNDLDLLTLYKLEEFLQNFGGCLLLVSHDRYFMDNIVDHLFVFEGNGKIKDFNGSYEEYKLFQKQNILEQTKENKKPETTEIPKVLENELTTPNKKKLSFKEKFELEQLGKQLEELSSEKKKIESELLKPDLEFDTLNMLAKKLQTINEDLDNKELRWLELSEMEN
jgi:ABC transport system ATP-binding/permease protein